MKSASIFGAVALKILKFLNYAQLLIGEISRMEEVDSSETSVTDHEEERWKGFLLLPPSSSSSSMRVSWTQPFVPWQPSSVRYIRPCTLYLWPKVEGSTCGEAAHL